MTSRTPKSALYPDSPNFNFLQEFLVYINQWENHASGGFLSLNTAEGLRVTIQSTLCLLRYLSSLGYRYLLTANLSQDRLENMFGIVRQSSGANDHPTASQFLITVNALAFYNLARLPKSGNCSPELISALVSTSKIRPRGQRTVDVLDALIDGGRIHDVETALEQPCVSSDHRPYVAGKSHDMIIYYIAGYVARKALKANRCQACSVSLATERCIATASDEQSLFTTSFDNGGLTYPAGPLKHIITVLEDCFATFFSLNRLNEQSMVNFSDFMAKSTLPSVGCSVHARAITAHIVKFYILLRFRFYTKALNSERAARHERMKLLKMRRSK